MIKQKQKFGTLGAYVAPECITLWIQQGGMLCGSPLGEFSAPGIAGVALGLDDDNNDYGDF